MSGLLALLDDVVALAKVAAATIDDAAAQAGKAGAKAAGIVIDDAAVTPRYVTGLAAKRELPIIGRIALGSLKNKLLFLLPAALILSKFAPWAITPILMLGGFYLAFEGYEKVHQMLVPETKDVTVVDVKEGTPEAARLEEQRVAGAIRTDFILSAEIMAIALNTITPPDGPQPELLTQGAVLAVVGLFITFLVYGAVALIVKADDVGVWLVNRGGVLAPVGRASREGHAAVPEAPELCRHDCDALGRRRDPDPQSRDLRFRRSRASHPRRGPRPFALLFPSHPASGLG